LRQAPDALALRGGPDKVTRQNLDFISAIGATIETPNPDGFSLESLHSRVRGFDELTSTADFGSSRASSESIPPSFRTDDGKIRLVGYPEETDVTEARGHEGYLRVRSECVWTLFGAYAWTAKEGKRSPKTLVWAESGSKLNMPISSALLSNKVRRKGGTGSYKMIDPETLPREEFIKLILRRTHWGQKLEYLCSNCPNPTKDMKKWARRLKRKIKAYINGLPNPFWSQKRQEKFLEEPTKVRPFKLRYKRFIEILKTVNGVFLTRLVGRPDERWTWRKYDILTLRNLEIFLEDEFRDGVLTHLGALSPTFYKAAKSYRKELKKSIIK
jgi:hypothetical protein